MGSIFDYTAKNWGLEQALLYTDRLESACAQLAEFPLRANDCGLIRKGYRRRRVEHHVIYFRQTSYGIAIMRILHEQMDASRHV